MSTPTGTMAFALTASPVAGYMKSIAPEIIEYVRINKEYGSHVFRYDNNLFSENKNFAASGDGGQLTIVFPELDLVFLRQQSCNLEKSGNMTWMGPDYLKLIASVVKEH